LATFELRSEQYLSSYKGAHIPGWWARGEVEHRGMRGGSDIPDTVNQGRQQDTGVANIRIQQASRLLPPNGTPAHAARQRSKKLNGYLTPQGPL
jgi:hypothetical protein